jgi:hypothetical protein
MMISKTEHRLTLILLVLFPLCCLACTDVLVTPGASEDGSAMIAYNADSGALMGTLYHYPATEGRGGEMRHVYDWDSGVSNECIRHSTLFNAVVTNKLNCSVRYVRS